jgi:PadR family transcriptional regulator, regulatory protein PadR
MSPEQMTLSIAPIDSLYVAAVDFYRHSIEAMPAPSVNLLQGTLDLLILKALALDPLHGLGISRRIEQITSGTFQVKPGSLFPALHRMEEAGWLASSWGESENNRRAKFYQLTKAGRRQLEVEAKQWGRISLAMARALEAN